MAWTATNCSVIAAYASATALPLSQVVVRLDGLYGNAAPLADLLAAEGPGVVVRGKAYHHLEQPVVQERLRRPPDQHTIHPESGMHRALYNCAQMALTPTGPVVRALLATHPAGSSRPPIGKVKEGTVSEQFFTTLPSSAFTPADVLELYLHRGSFETVLADEDQVSPMLLSLLRLPHRGPSCGEIGSGARSDDDGCSCCRPKPF